MMAQFFCPKTLKWLEILRNWMVWTLGHLRHTCISRQMSTSPSRTFLAISATLPSALYVNYFLTMNSEDKVKNQFTVNDIRVLYYNKTVYMLWYIHTHSKVWRNSKFLTWSHLEVHVYYMINWFSNFRVRYNIKIVIIWLIQIV